MKSVFDKTTRDELIYRISSLNENSAAEWGKMNISQMLQHCTLCEEMYLGKRKYKRTLFGRLFGKLALKNLLKDERPLQPNAPTGLAFKIQETSGNVEEEKLKWISLIEEYIHYSNHNFEHWFFGRMKKDQVGYFVYKHADHHLRQFKS